jgi:2-oxoglutarate ferredoxin oxidoreductase subunit beta
MQHQFERDRENHAGGEKQEFLTGLIYVNPKTPDFLTQLNMVDEPLATLPESRTRPGREALEAIMNELK